MNMFRCRVCLVFYKEFEVSAIDTEELNRNIKIADAFLQITAINAFDLGEDRFICKSCLSRLRTAFDFRIEALNSYEYLNNHNNVLNNVDTVNVNIKVEKVDVFEKDDDGYWPEADTDIFFKCEPHFEVKDEQPLYFGPQHKQTRKYVKSDKKKVVKPKVRIDDGLSKSYCRFCLQYIGTKLGDHERQHISKLSA